MLHQMLGDHYAAAALARIDEVVGNAGGDRHIAQFASIGERRVAKSTTPFARIALNSPLTARILERPARCQGDQFR